MKAILKTLIALPLSFLPQPQHPQYPREGLNLGWRLGWLRGWIKRPLWKLMELRGGPRVIVGKRFCLYGNMSFSGPGTLVIGNDVIVNGQCTPFTHASGAVIRIGDRTFLNGTRFGCAQSIEIGADCIMADARLMDTDFHAVHKRRNEAGMGPDVKPVLIGRNVWIAAGSAVLKGVEIGDNSVVAFGSVVVKSLAADRIFGGNPAKEIGPVPEGPQK
jgi:acetyltransferase-like isoleucine patch superfamily enzyme